MNIGEISKVDGCRCFIFVGRLCLWSCFADLIFTGDLKFARFGILRRECEAIVCWFGQYVLRVQV